MSDITSNNNRLDTEELVSLANEFFPLKNATVTSANFKPFSSERLGFLGTHELLAIEAHEQDGDSSETKKTATFFVKSLIQAPTTFDKFVFQEESKFYREVMPELMRNSQTEPWSAKCSLVKHNLFVLEDLKAEGYKVSGDFLTYDELKSAVECLARFHASSILLEEKLGKPLNQVYPDYFMEKVYTKDESLLWRWLAAGIEVVEAVAETLGLDAKHASMAYELAIVRAKRNEPSRNVICHRDLWRNNLLLKKSDDKVACRLVDFQLVSYTSYALDLVTLVYLNTTRSARYSDDMIELYHKALETSLRENGSKTNVSLFEVKRDFIDKRICGLVASVQYLPIVLLDGETIVKFAGDAESFETHMFVSRRDFILRVMKRDDAYRDKVERAVKELIEYVEKL